MEDRLIWAGAMVVIVGFYATPLFPLWLIIKGLKMKRYLVLLLMCSPALAQTPEMVTQSTAASCPTPATTITTTGPVTIGTCKEPTVRRVHSHPKIIAKRKP